MMEIIEKLKQWGCDTKNALERMVDDEEFYISCLMEIPGDRNFSLLEEALAKKDVDAAFSAAHTLKGVCANLGLTPMFNICVELVEPLRAGSCEGLGEKLELLKQSKIHLEEILKG